MKYITQLSILILKSESRTTLHIKHLVSLTCYITMKSNEGTLTASDFDENIYLPQIDSDRNRIGQCKNVYYAAMQQQ